jgi:2-oxoglutarate ferredoxin oxidoreductase subunit gamma
MNTERLLFSGFGGQGIMLMGELLSHAAMIEGKSVSWLPSYGPEMRGGTASCSVTISDEEISSPVIVEPTVLVAMNRPSLKKYVDAIVSGGVLFLNDSVFCDVPDRDDIRIVHVPCGEIAESLNNSKMANMVMLGALIKSTGIVGMASVVAAMEKKFTGAKKKFIPLNKDALVSWKETSAKNEDVYA